MYKYIKYLLFLLPPEKAHNLTFLFLKNRFFTFFISNSRKSIKKFDLGYNLFAKNRVGLAAGLDKNAEAVEGLSKLGFGFVEVGTVTPKAQSGNYKPRLFRVIDKKSIINRMGFNNLGVENMVLNLKKLPKKRNYVVGVNIGKNKVTPNEKAQEDYLFCLEKLYDYGDYFCINISSPNTPNLRELQDPENIKKIILPLTNYRDSKGEGNKKPIFVKLAPDINEETIKLTVKAALDAKIDGFILTNTTLDKNLLGKGEEFWNKTGDGGISGKVLFEKSNKLISKVRETVGDKCTIIAVGGIFSDKDALEKIKLGADAVQIYSGLIYEGPKLINEIEKALEK